MQIHSRIRYQLILLICFILLGNEGILYTRINADPTIQYPFSPSDEIIQNAIKFLRDNQEEDIKVEVNENFSKDKTSSHSISRVDLIEPSEEKVEGLSIRCDKGGIFYSSSVDWPGHRHRDFPFRTVQDRRCRVFWWSVFMCMFGDDLCTRDHRRHGHRFCWQLTGTQQK